MKHSEILIIGGGVIGLSIARELHRRGAGRITVVDRSSFGLESSWAAGGMLGPQAEAEETGLFFDFCSASRDLYPDLAAELLEETGVDIELDRTGTLYVALTGHDANALERRFEWQKAEGLSVEPLSAEEVRRREPFISPDVRFGLYFADDWQVDNRKLVSAFKRYAYLNGITLAENTKIDRLIVDGDRVVGAAGDQEFRAGHTILATGAWTSLIKIGVGEMPFRVEPVRGQMVVFQLAKRLFSHVIYSTRGYIVPRLDGRVLAGSTSEKVGFDKSTTEEAATGLRAMASEIAPSTAGLPTADHWSGLRPYVFDGFPVIGNLSGLDGLTIATAHYRNGILLAPLTARLVGDSVLNADKDGLPREFAPGRFRLSGVVARS